MRLAPQLELVALRVPGPLAPGHVDVVLRPRRTLAPGPLGFRQAVEGAVAVGALAQRAGAVARGGGVRAMGAAPDDEDEEGAQGGEAGGYDGDGGLGGGPDGDGDVVPWVRVSVFERRGLCGGRGVDVHVISSLLAYWWRTMRRITLTAQTLVELLGCRGFEGVGEEKGRGGLREAHGEDSSQDEFLRLARPQAPENRDRLWPCPFVSFLLLGNVSHLSYSPLTSAKSTKSVAALMDPTMRKYSSTLIHLPPNSGVSVPARVSQKAWMGTHWNTETKTQEMVKQTTK